MVTTRNPVSASGAIRHGRQSGGEIAGRRIGEHNKNRSHKPGTYDRKTKRQREEKEERIEEGSTGVI